MGPVLKKEEEGIRVYFLIYPTFPPFLVDVGYNHSHLNFNKLPLKCESPTLGSDSRSPTEPNQGSNTICWGVRGAPGAATS